MKTRSLFLVVMTLALGAGPLRAHEPDLRPFDDVAPIRETETQLTSGPIELIPLHPGETVHRKATTREPQLFKLHLEAGTSVTITFGPREMPMSVWLFAAPSSGAITSEWLRRAEPIERMLVAPEGAVEPFAIVAEQTSDYVLNLGVPNIGEYTFNCSEAHPATIKDRSYAEANRIFVSIRQAYEAGQPLNNVRVELERRAAIYRQFGDHSSLGLALLDVALLHIDNHELDEAILAINDAKNHFEAANSQVNVYDAVYQLASANESLGNYQKGVDLLNDLLDRAKAMGSKRLEYQSLFKFGVFYHRLGDVTKAREYYDRATDMARSVDPPDLTSLSEQGLYYTNLGNLYRGMNGGEIPIPAFPPRTRDDYEQALTFLRKAVEVNQQIELKFPGYVTLLTFNQKQIANTYKELGRYDEALSVLNRLLTKELSLERPSKSQLASYYRLIGSIYAREGDVSKTVENFDCETKLLRDGASNYNRDGYFLGMADDYVRVGDLQRAATTVKEALEFSRTVEAPTQIADDLLSLARIERALGNFNSARSEVEEGLQIEEALRERISNDELRTTYFLGAKRFYDFYIDLLMQSRMADPSKNLDVLALQANEKARARTLLDLLTISGVDVKKGIDPSLIEREKHAREQLMTKADEQTRLMLRKHTAEEADRVRAEMLELTNTYESIQTEIRNKSPKYAALAPANALSVKQIQGLLDPGTALLEYALGEKKSFLWVVTRDGVSSYDLASRDEIESTARRAYASITERNRTIKGETSQQTKVRLRNAETGYVSASALLSEKLLGPAAALIQNKRLVIVPDGALNFISFASLPSPQQAAKGATALLGADHEIVVLPSASTLAVLRNGAQSRTNADEMIAIFADPVFDTADARTRPARSSVPTQRMSGSTRDFERAIADVGLTPTTLDTLPRLPFSRREADAIFAASPKGLSVKNVDFDASKQNVFDERLDRYRIIHFASHSLLDSDHPDYSGIVLSLVDREGRPVDGFLRLRDIYDLKLNADLVVLSACNTALGAEVRGEGLIGLTRGFMYAGTSRVIASLWKVDDAATAELMSIFYRNMFKQQMRPAAALRSAQNEIRKQPRWSSPYYWAPFVLQGDWR